MAMKDKPNVYHVIITVLLVMLTAAITYAVAVNGTLSDVKIATAVAASERAQTQRDIDRLVALMEQLVKKLPDPE